MKPKTIYTANIDDAINYAFEQRIRQYQDFLKAWSEYFGEDYEAQAQAFQDNIDDRLTLGIVDKCYDMGVIENWRYLASLARLAKAGGIRRKKRGSGWMVVKQKKVRT